MSWPNYLFYKSISLFRRTKDRICVTGLSSNTKEHMTSVFVNVLWDFMQPVHLNAKHSQGQPDCPVWVSVELHFLHWTNRKTPERHSQPLQHMLVSRENPAVLAGSSRTPPKSQQNSSPTSDQNRWDASLCYLRQIPYLTSLWPLFQSVFLLTWQMS